MMSASARVLRVDAGGFPLVWITWMCAAELYATQRVLWADGDDRIVLRGGRDHHGRRSQLAIAPIVATDAVHQGARGRVPALTNRALAVRDAHLCLYCGRRHSERELTRDHVRPRSRGGEDVWANVVAACKRCNNRKDNRLPEEAGMRLLAVPYTPNEAEALILSNRRILADQQAYLERMVPDRSSRWH